MKFIVSSNKLLKYLQSSASLLSTSQSIQYTQYFLLELADGKLKVTATDSESMMISTLEVESESEGAVCVLGRTLLDLIKSLPDQPVTFTLNPELKVLEIIYETGKANLAVIDTDEYPRMREIEALAEVRIPTEVLSTAISKTLFATGNDEIRLALTGVFFQLTSEGCTFVATDGHKLSKYKRTDITSEQTSEFIVPKKALSIVKNLLPDAESVLISSNNTNVKFITDDQVFITKLVEARYPMYENVIPKDNPNQLRIARNTLLSALKRISIIASKTSNLVKLTINGSMLSVLAEDIELSNRAEENLPCDYTGADMSIGFNSKNLIEILSNLESEFVRMEMSIPSKPSLVFPEDGLNEGEEVLMLIMPLMIT